MPSAWATGVQFKIQRALWFICRDLTDPLFLRCGDFVVLKSKAGIKFWGSV